MSSCRSRAFSVHILIKQNDC